tara:strand:+ start:448 stop:885 length:438 start_codon:yes stop_codon:yes gene_type:complete
MEMTEFQKAKQNEWDEFGKTNQTSKIELLKENSLFLIFGFLIFFFAIVGRTEAGEWNEKPVVCANEQETFIAIKTKKEDLIFKATQLTKVRTDAGLAIKPVGVAVDMYVNPETGTYTIIEYHPSYESYCVISYGINFQVFIGGVQ